MIFHHPPNTPPSFNSLHSLCTSFHSSGRQTSSNPLWPLYAMITTTSCLEEVHGGGTKEGSHMEVTAVWSRPQLSPLFSVALSGHHRWRQGWRGVCLSSLPPPHPFSCCLTGWTCGRASASGGHTKYRPGSQPYTSHQKGKHKTFKGEKYPDF